MIPELVPLTIEAARKYWPYAQPLIEALRVKCNERWQVTDVWDEIEDRTAVLCVAFDEQKEPAGIIVYQVATTAYSRDLHLWIVCENSVARAADYWPQIRVIRDANRCNAITFESPRRWEKAVPSLKVRYLYREEAEHVGG